MNTQLPECPAFANAPKPHDNGAIRLRATQSKYQKTFTFRYYFLPGLIWLLAATYAVAQTGTPVPALLPTTFLPTSPTITSFQRFDKQQNVNLITGAAQATVPLASLHSGPLQVGVALTYSFGGLKVVQPPDLVGLGWALQAGGSISRRVAGRLDETQGGKGPYNSDTVEANLEKRLFLKQALEGDADASPDVYDFSVAGYQGRFLVQDNTIVLLPQQPIQIRLLPNGAGFQLAGEDGVRYVFTTAELTIPHHQNFGTLGSYISAWHLTRIISASNADTVQFRYSDWNYHEKQRVAQTSLQVLQSAGTLPVSYLDKAPQNSWVYGSIIHTKVLASITTRNACVLISRDSQHVVQSVRLLSTLRGQQTAVRTMTLGHSFFAGLSVQAPPRLRLDWVREGNGTQRLPAYQFSYDTTMALPSTASTGQDHWGYYNGTGSDDGSGTVGISALLPLEVLIENGLSSPDRSPHWEAAGAGALQRITYPTGGSTTFAYEPNSYAIGLKPYSTSISYDISASGRAPNDSLRLLQGIRFVAGGSNMATKFDRHSCASQLLIITAPTRVSFILNVTPLHPTVANDYKNIIADFMLVRGDTILEQYKASAGSNTRAWSEELQPGTYTAWVMAQPEERNTDSNWSEANELYITVPGKQQMYYPTVLGDGIRVRQTVTTTIGAPPLTHTYTYQLDTPDGPRSSGNMLLPIDGAGKPIYPFKPYMEARVVGSDPVKRYLNFTSDNTRFGNEYNKYSFYYSRVTEQEGDAGALVGETAHCFRLQPSNFNDVVPAGEEIYRATLNAKNKFQLVQTERRHYGDYSTSSPIFVAARPYSIGFAPASNLWVVNKPEAYDTDFYHVRASFLAPDSTVTVRYGEKGDSSVAVTRTLYRQQRPVRVTTRTSDGTKRISTVSYLSDYSPTLPGFAQLRANNFNPVVEVQHWRRLAGQADTVLTGGEATRYDPKWRQPTSTWHLDLAQPVAGPNAQQLTNGAYTTWLRDTRYRRLNTERYDPVTSDPVGQQVAAGPETAYVWGYQRTELVAQVQNATPAQVAYSGFEAGELGRWQGLATAIATPGYTGDAGYGLSAGLACQGLPAGDYRISCRRQGTGGPMTVNGQVLTPTGPAQAGWMEYATTVAVGPAGRVQLVGTGQVDDVCLYPVGARMSSYTHVPLVGIASQTDPSGRTVRYEYDALGRLVRTRDEQGHILSQQQYHYARP